MTNWNIKTKSGSLQKMAKKKSSQEQDELAHAERCSATAELPLVFKLCHIKLAWVLLQAAAVLSK